MTVRVALFIDWQNAYKSARRAFELEAMPNEHGNFSPYQLGRLVAAAHDRGSDGHLVKVEVHRGLPSTKHDPIGYAANRRQSQEWMKEAPDIVIPRLRPLRYAVDGSPSEKGVDVQLALGAVECVTTNGCDVAVIFSHDTDLLPAVESIARMKGPHCVETASWRSETFNSRLRPRGQRGVFNHEISKKVFDLIETPVNYAYRGEK